MQGMTKWMKSWSLWATVGVSAALAGGGGAQAFTCGGDLATYRLLDGPGVRCVKFVDRRSFAWYGEGQWGGAAYRHLGYAIGPLEVITAATNVFTGTAADFLGNGESIGGTAPGTLRIEIPNQPAWNALVPPQTIRVVGGWNETWVRAPGGVPEWTPLGPVTNCGPNLQAFRAAAPGAGSSSGVRCLLRADGKLPAAWYGEGTWGNSGYRHLGTASFDLFGPRWGASDLCEASRPGTVMFCGSTRFGDLNLSSFAGGSSFRVTGAWNEFWNRP